MTRDPTKQLANWAEERSFEIELDIGCSSGIFLCRVASRFSKRRFLGIDYREDCIKNSLYRIQSMGLTNVTALEYEAVAFLSDEELAPTNSVTTIHAYYPTPDPMFLGLDDPLLRLEFFVAAARVIRQGGLLRIATDDDVVFSSAIKEIPFDLWTPVEWHTLDLGLSPERVVGSRAEIAYRDDPMAKANYLQLLRRIECS